MVKLTVKKEKPASNIIQVPKPSKGSYDPHRALNRNALLRNQVEHFQHLENKLPAKSRTGVDHASIKTEGHAAEYIRQMTHILHSPAKKAAKKKVGAKKAKPLSKKAAEPATKSKGAGK